MHPAILHGEGRPDTWLRSGGNRAYCPMYTVHVDLFQTVNQSIGWSETSYIKLFYFIIFMACQTNNKWNNEIILKGGWEGCNPLNPYPLKPSCPLNPFPLRRHYKGINPPFIHCPIFSLEFWKSNFLELQLVSTCRSHFLPVRWSNWVFVFSVTMPSPLHVHCTCSGFCFNL